MASPAATKLLFICTGNTCRSPFAAAVARRERPDLEVSSAGTRADPDMPCPDEAVQAASALGLELEAHRSRQLDRELVAAADLLVGMDAHHVQAIAALGGAEKARTLAEVPILDPYGGDEREYRLRYGEIEAAVRSLLDGLPPPTAPPRVGREDHPPPASSVPRIG